MLYVLTIFITELFENPISSEETPDATPANLARQTRSSATA